MYLYGTATPGENPYAFQTARSAPVQSSASVVMGLESMQAGLAHL